MKFRRGTGDGSNPLSPEHKIIDEEYFLLDKTVKAIELGCYKLVQRKMQTEDVTTVVLYLPACSVYTASTHSEIFKMSSGVQ